MQNFFANKTELNLGGNKKIYTRLKQLISITASILSLFFAWLQFDGMSFAPIMTQEVSDLLVKLAVTLYYFSWIFGAISDMKSKKKALKLHPQMNSLSIGAATVMAGIIGLFVLLCIVDTKEYFILALSGFFIFNIISWKYFIFNYVKPIIKENKKEIESPIEYEYLNTLKVYLIGKWQIYRFIFGGVVLLIINLMIFSPVLNSIALSNKINPEFTISLSLLLYVLTFEAWVWTRRIIRIYTFKVLENLKNKI